MPYRTHHAGPVKRFFRKHGQTLGLCVIVLLVVVAVALLVWFMSDMRFRSRPAVSTPFTWLMAEHSCGDSDVLTLSL